MSELAVSIEDLTLVYEQKAVFADLSLTLYPRQWVAILGASGIGKTSFLRVLAGLTTTKERSLGTIIVNNQKPLSEQIVYMAQTDLLLPWLNSLDNVLLSIKLRSHTPSQYLQIKTRAIQLLQQVGLNEASTAYPHELSGGMRQRVALVRALLEDKPIVLMDEPFSALDTITRYQLQNLAAELLKDKIVVFITHDPLESLRLANHIYIMHDSPAKLTPAVTLKTNTPRELNSPELMQLHKTILGKLL